MIDLDAVRHAWVLGLGRSGLAAARLLRARGVAVTVVDARAPDAAAAADLAAMGAAVRAPCGPELEGGADLAVASPGVPESGTWISGLRARGVPVLSEVELGWRRRGAARVLAVTGSNGKSTLVKLCAETLARAGRKAVPCGNYGLPVCEVVRREAWDWLVIEVSTFQIETVADFRPDIGVLLNLYPNHLDRHGTFEAYAALKGRLFERMEPGDVALARDEALARLPDPRFGGGTRRLFGLGPACDYRYADGRVARRDGAVVSFMGTAFANPILGAAAAAAAGAMEAAGVPAAALEEAARDFAMLPHRMQPVRTLGGVRFINDSKATNLAALAAALTMTPPPVRLIAGGLLKEADVGSVKDLLAKSCVKIYGIGKTAGLLEQEWGGCAPFENCRDLATAVKAAWREAKEGDTVLLSPGCASFDQFRNFEERGDRFICVVQALETEKARP